MFRYEYTGDTPVVFSDLTGIRKAQGLPGEVQPGETIESPVELFSALLTPAGDAPRGRKSKADDTPTPDTPAGSPAGQED